MCTYLLIIYLMIGCVYTRHWWYVYHRKDYNIAKSKGEANDSLVILNWLFSIVFWPIALISYKKNKN